MTVSVVSKLVALVLLGCVLTDASCTRREPAESITVVADICSVIRSPQLFAGRRVRLRARVETDNYHYWSLSAYACRYQSIAFRQVHGVTALDRLPDNSEAIAAGTERVSATFTGVVFWRTGPPTYLEWIIRGPDLMLYVEEVSDVRVVRTPQSPTAPTAPVG